MAKALPKTLPAQFRTAVIQRDQIDIEARTVPLSFSSETPVETWWGTEILGHDTGEVDLSRIASGSAPLLMDHNTRDLVGVIETAGVKEKRGVAVARFGKSARAEEIFQDVLGGIRSSISVGYCINELVATDTDGDGDFEEYRATNWTPLEISIVSIPADPSVGIGRSEELRREYPVNVKQKEIRQMPPANPSPAAPGETAVITQPQREGAAVLSQEQVNKYAQEAREAEMSRMREIEAIGAKWNCADFAREHIQKGTSLELFRGLVLEREGPQKAQEKLIADASVGMSRAELSRYSLVRVLRSMAEVDAKKRGAEAGFELEVSAEVAKRSGKTPKGFFVPMDVRAAGVPGARSLTQGTANKGGNLVETELLADSMIELLRNRMMVRQMGARMLSGLVGNIAIPKQSGAASFSWVAEDSADGGSDQTVVQVPLSPKAATGWTDMSRRLLQQSSIDVEAFVRDDLMKVLGIGIDLAAINGSGAANVPTGILNASGLALVPIGTNGGAVTWAAVVGLETDVSTANADVGTLGYLVNAKQRGAMKTTPKVAGYPDYIWPDRQPDLGPGFGMVNGYRTGVTNQVPGNLTKGTGTNLSAIIFGNWEEVFIGEWGELDILVDPYTNSTKGTVRVVEFQSIDIAIRHIESFAAIVDAL